MINAYQDEKTHLVSVIIPAYNESSIIQQTLTKLCNFLESKGLDHEVIVCDDCSGDNMLSIVKSFASLNGRIVPLRFCARIGKGGTIKNAARVATGRILMILDADLPAPLSMIPQTVEIVRRSGGLAVGVRRVITGGSYGTTRRLLSASYNVLVRTLFRTGIRDHQTGFKAIDTQAARKVFSEVRSDTFLFDTDLIVNTRRLKIPVTAVEVDWMDPRVTGTSKVIPLRAALAMLIDLLALRLSIVHGRRIMAISPVNGGVFVDEAFGTAHPITQFHLSLRTGGLLDFLRRIYLKVIFG